MRPLHWRIFYGPVRYGAMRMTRPNQAWLAASFAALLLAGCDSWNADAPVDADTALAANQWHAAARALSARLDEDPGNAELAGKRVRALLALGDGEGATAAIRRLAEANPQAAATDEWQLMRAEADIWRGQPRMALAVLDRLTGSEQARLASLAHSHLGNHEVAQAALVSALARYPEEPRLNADMALRLMADGNLDGAAVHVSRALRAAPRSLDARVAEARLLELQGDLDTAQARLESLAGDFPDSRTPRLALGRVLLARGRSDDAGRVVAGLWASGLGSFELVLLDARIAASANRWSDVRNLLQAHEGELRDDPEAQLLYAIAFGKLGQANSAQAVLERLVSRYPQFHAARAQLAEQMLDTGQIDQAARIAKPLRALPDLPPEGEALIARIDRALQG